ncbi:hypothetical protein GQ44DRAFT_734004 [Phaeosphaeriaceae sp. PMI808]|nr:hypothetical protein GQ44DRAFT_734004 [Phaeosphaeriaceae sp. PMI808]
MFASDDKRMAPQHELIPGKGQMQGELTPKSGRSKSASRRVRRQRARGDTPEGKLTKTASPGLITDAESQNEINSLQRIGTNTSTDASTSKMGLVESNANGDETDLDQNRTPVERSGLQVTIKTNLEVEIIELKASIKGDLALSL